jgi:hypothetical protein
MLTALRVAAALSLFGLAGCAMSPQDFPTPSLAPDGGRAYAMTGYVRYTSSLPEAKAWVQNKMDEACGGPSKFLQYNPVPTTNPFGVPFVKYDVIAECQPQP